MLPEVMVRLGKAIMQAGGTELEKRLLRQICPVNLPCPFILLPIGLGHILKPQLVNQVMPIMKQMPILLAFGIWKKSKGQVPTSKMLRDITISELSPLLTRLSPEGNWVE